MLHWFFISENSIHIINLHTCTHTPVYDIHFSYHKSTTHNHYCACMHERGGGTLALAEQAKLVMDDDASKLPASLWEGLACETSVCGNSLFMAFIDSESVAIAILWRLSTPIVGVNSLGLLYWVGQ
jgi:transcription elongation factor GreA-like protein